MPNNSIGYSFAPTFQNAELAKAGVPNASPQQALQTLSFQLKPKMAGAPGNADGLSPLQGTERVGSSIAEAVLASVLRTVLGVDAASMLPDGRGDSYSDSMRRERQLPRDGGSDRSPIRVPGYDPGPPVPDIPQRSENPRFGIGDTAPTPDVPMLPDGSGDSYGDSQRRERNLPQFSDVRRGSNKYGPDGWMDDIRQF